MPSLCSMPPFPEAHRKRKQKPQCQMVQRGARQAVPGGLGSYESSINAKQLDWHLDTPVVHKWLWHVCPGEAGLPGMNTFSSTGDRSDVWQLSYGTWLGLGQSICDTRLCGLGFWFHGSHILKQGETVCS